MAARLLLLRPPPLTRSLTTLTFCSLLAAPLVLFPQPLLSPLRSYACTYRMDELARPLSAYSRSARNPVVREDGRLNTRVFRQISAGSIIGLGAGIAISFFSKPLALLFGLLVLGAQALETRGIHVLPYASIQRAVKGVNVRSALQDNVAFKLSFGLTCALASFGSF